MSHAVFIVYPKFKRKGVSCDLPGNSVSKWGSPRVERRVQGGREAGGGREGEKQEQGWGNRRMPGLPQIPGLWQ